jgi:hypothetical protein
MKERLSFSLFLNTRRRTKGNKPSQHFSLMKCRERGEKSSSFNNLKALSPALWRSNASIHNQIAPAFSVAVKNVSLQFMEHCQRSFARFFFAFALMQRDLTSAMSNIRTEERRTSKRAQTY